MESGMVLQCHVLLDLVLYIYLALEITYRHRRSVLWGLFVSFFAYTRPHYHYYYYHHHYHHHHYPEALWQVLTETNYIPSL